MIAIPPYIINVINYNNYGTDIYYKVGFVIGFLEYKIGQLCLIN